MSDDDDGGRLAYTSEITPRAATIQAGIYNVIFNNCVCMYVYMHNLYVLYEYTIFA